jgi:hypothetical protein
MDRYRWFCLILAGCLVSVALAILYLSLACVFLRSCCCAVAAIVLAMCFYAAAAWILVRAGAED